MSTDVSEEHIAFIFRVEDEAEQETSIKGGGKQRRHVPPKPQLPFNGLHRVLSQKIVLFINTTVRTSNPITIKTIITDISIP
jgi:hypothetical protein